jgi:hypothetical protein
VKVAAESFWGCSVWGERFSFKLLRGSGRSWSSDTFPLNAVGRDEEEVLSVAEVGDLADLGTGLIVDTDLCADVAFVVVTDGVDVAVGREDGFHGGFVEVAFVVEGDELVGAADFVDEVLHCDDGFGFGVEVGLACFAIDSFVGDAVGFGFVPADERFPDVVVPEVGVLIVRGVDVREVGGELSCGVLSFEVGCGAGAVWERWEKIGDAEFEFVVGARGPFFEVCHLHAGGGVDSVGGFHQRDEHDGFEIRVQVFGFNGLTDRVDAGAVFGFEVAGVLAECFGEVSGLWIELIELGHELIGVVQDFVSIGLDVAGREAVRIGCVIVGGDLISLRFERMTHA